MIFKMKNRSQKRPVPVTSTIDKKLAHKQRQLVEDENQLVLAQI